MDDVSRQIGELRKEMREGFRDVRSEIRDVRSEIRDVRSEIKGVRSEIKDVRSELGLRLDSVNTAISTLWASMVGGYVALIVGFILTRS